MGNQDKETLFGETIYEQIERLKKTSPFGNFATYKLFKIIVKSGEDLRQEQFATQLINEFYQIFKLEKTDCWVNPYEILSIGVNVGIIEVVPNSVSIDQMKRKSKDITSLRQFYQTYFGPITSKTYKAAMKNFIQSLAGYSLVCYFLQIKDRHNANILIDNLGHLIHIDFGFMLSNSPGKGIKFEKAPFKLTKEFVDVMGGVNSKYFTKFRKLLWK
jgi:phosphatidylinositol 4-kinase